MVGCAFIWGASFTLNKTLLTSVSPMVYVAARFSLGCLLLSPLYRHTTRADWRAGLPLGLLFGLQLSLFAAGLSQTLDSYHLTGDAVDLAVIVGGKAVWKFEAYEALNDLMQHTAHDLAVPLTWGGGWARLRDGPHFQTVRGV